MFWWGEERVVFGWGEENSVFKWGEKRRVCVLVRRGEKCVQVRGREECDWVRGGEGCVRVVGGSGSTVWVHSRGFRTSDPQRNVVGHSTAEMSPLVSMLLQAFLNPLQFLMEIFHHKYQTTSQCLSSYGCAITVRYILYIIIIYVVDCHADSALRIYQHVFV